MGLEGLRPRQNPIIQGRKGGHSSSIKRKICGVLKL